MHMHNHVLCVHLSACLSVLVALYELTLMHTSMQSFVRQRLTYANTTRMIFHNPNRAVELITVPVDLLC